jgi:alpha-glucosidase
LAGRYSFSELRGATGTAGLPVMERIADRTHAWEDRNGGLDGIVKKCLIMSTFGYPFNAPDMVGGGLIGDKDGKEDQELNIRYMQTAALMPAMQFSKTLWTYNTEMKKAVMDMLALRKKYTPLLLEELEKSGYTGEPTLKTLFYKYGVYPENFEQFFIGDKLIVAPVVKKGQTEQTVYLPDGKWVYIHNGKAYDGGKTVTVPAPLEVLPCFEKGV